MQILRRKDFSKICFGWTFNVRCLFAFVLEVWLSVDFLASAYLMSVLIAVFFIDLDHMIIPTSL